MARQIFLSEPKLEPASFNIAFDYNIHCCLSNKEGWLLIWISWPIILHVDFVNEVSLKLLDWVIILVLYAINMFIDLRCIEQVIEIRNKLMPSSVQMVSEKFLPDSLIFCGGLITSRIGWVHSCTDHDLPFCTKTFLLYRFQSSILIRSRRTCTSQRTQQIFVCDSKLTNCFW